MCFKTAGFYTSFYNGNVVLHIIAMQGWLVTRTTRMISCFYAGAGRLYKMLDKGLFETMLKLHQRFFTYFYLAET